MAPYCDGSFLWWLLPVMAPYCDGSLLWWLLPVMAPSCDGSLLWWLLTVMAPYCDGTLPIQFVTMLYQHDSANELFMSTYSLSSLLTHLLSRKSIQCNCDILFSLYRHCTCCMSADISKLLICLHVYSRGLYIYMWCVISGNLCAPSKAVYLQPKVRQ